MNISAAWFVVLLILALWGAGAMAVGFADAMYRRRQREMLDIRDWREKVDAMRRLQDAEGDA